MKHDYDALREMVGLGRPGKQVIKDRKGRVLKQPIIKWSNPTYTKYMSMGTAQPLKIHTAPPFLAFPLAGASMVPHAVERVKRGCR
jgi:hypothetical protein